ncbi:MAG: alpha-L-fucosidase [Caldilineaceae bacterium]|nr:alpha-L-fucosidase [Caldilinea sp.]MCB9120726.1 alpha-L-fucosidase [Caldilineaceae bacterium]HRW49484.1 alpha-L-fucosidase [Caldilinea sp.]
MTTQASPNGLAWFQDARFGMFIHWGLYSIIGKQEWVMHTDRIPVPEYEKLVPQFNPTRFDADAWVRTAAEAGQKYIVITSRHHDGFSMYDTALSDYKVTNTPFRRDPLAELAEACTRHGVKLGFYVSLLDWHHPAYRFRAESGLAWADYIGFLHGQVRELCTQYGEVAAIWFDGDWPRSALDPDRDYFLAGGSFEYEKLYGMIHELQPDAVIENNRHAEPMPGEDLQGFEQDLPGENTTGFNETTIYGLPIQVCMTINDHWGWSRDDRNTKSARRLVHVLAKSASVGGNLLLNVGPTPEGEIPALHQERLREVGRWLAQNGDGIYYTRAGVIPPTRETVSTRRGDRHFIHVLDYVSDCVILAGVPEHIHHARLVASGRALEIEREGENFFVSADSDRTTICIPPDLRDPHDTVIELF